MRTLIEKELRENLRWLLVGLALIGSLLWYAVPKSLAVEIRQTEHSLATMMFFGATLFAIGLGVMQSFGDLRTASRSFLFHRSVSISTIFYSKLISGAIIYFASVGLPLLAVSLWFAWKGIDYLPVRPMQVYPAAVTALASFGFHPAAMFMLARSGKWFGTKMLPLLFVVPLIPLGLSTVNTMMHGLAINILIVGFILLGLLTLIVAAREAWVYSMADEGNLSRRPVGFAHIVTLSFAAILVCLVCIGPVHDFASGLFWRVPPSEREVYAFDTDGNPWRAKRKGYKENYISGDKLRRDEVPDVRGKLPEELKLQMVCHLTELHKPVSFFENGENTARDRQCYFDSRGNVLLYDRTLRPPLQAIVSRNGKPFAGNPLSQNVWMSGVGLLHLSEDQLVDFWLDPKGVYRYSETTQEVKTLFDFPVDAFGIFYGSRREFFILSEGKFHLFRLTDQKGNAWVRPTAKSPKDAWDFEIQEISVTPPLPPTSIIAMKICIIGDSKFTVVLDGPRPTFLTFNSESDTSWNSTSFRMLKGKETVHGLHLMFSLLPWLLSIIVSVVTAIGNHLQGKTLLSIDEVSYFIQDEYAFVILAIIVMLLSMIATIYACRRRMLSRSQTISWCCWAVLLGWATPLAVLAIYTRPTCSRCTRCEKQRRIDLRKCEHCGSEWERPAPKGIEIFDESFSSDKMLALDRR